MKRLMVKIYVILGAEPGAEVLKVFTGFMKCGPMDSECRVADS
jgi:hypothetical protein